MWLHQSTINKNNYDIYQVSRIDGQLRDWHDQLIISGIKDYAWSMYSATLICSHLTTWLLIN